MIFGPKHDILELPQVPRQRDVLQSLLNEARAQRRARRLKMVAALICAVAALGLLLMFAGRLTGAPVVVANTPMQTVYLPLMNRLEVVQNKE